MSGPEAPPVRNTEEIEELARSYGAVQVLPEAGFEFIHLETLRFLSDGDQVEVEGLLCPQMRDGYATRLFLGRPFTNKGQNWTQHQILGRPWHSWSWKDIRADQRLIQILLGHLKALR